MRTTQVSLLLLIALLFNVHAGAQVLSFDHVCSTRSVDDTIAYYYSEYKLNIAVQLVDRSDASVNWILEKHYFNGNEFVGVQTHSIGGINELHSNYLVSYTHCPLPASMLYQVGEPDLELEANEKIDQALAIGENDALLVLKDTLKFNYRMVHVRSNEVVSIYQLKYGSPPMKVDLRILNMEDIGYPCLVIETKHLGYETYTDLFLIKKGERFSDMGQDMIQLME